MSTLTPDAIEGMTKLGLGPEDSASEDTKQTRSSFKQIVCNRCRFRPEFSTVEKLYTHLHQRHSLCLVCGVFVRTASEFHQHISKHPQCMLCEKRYLNWNELEQHYFNHTGSRLECPLDGCDFQAARHTHIIQHLESDSCPRIPNRLCIDTYFLNWSELNNIHYFDGIEKYTPSGNFMTTYKYPGCLEKQNSLSLLFEHVELEGCPHVLQEHSTSLLTDVRASLYDSIRRNNQKPEYRSRTKESSSDSESDFEMGESDSEPEE